MSFCKNCGTEINGNETQCPNCGMAQEVKPAVVDKGGFLWGLLGCCVPVAGLVLFLIWKDSKPKTAKAAGIGALVSVILAVIYYILIIAIGIGAGMMG